MAEEVEETVEEIKLSSTLFKNNQSKNIYEEFFILSAT